MAKKNEVSYVLRSKNRLRVMESIVKYGKAIPAQIQKETGMYKSHVSRTIKELEDIDAVKCTNPDDRNYRFYALNQKGKTLLKKAKEITYSSKK